MVKKSIQKAILRTLSGKNALSADSVKKDAERVILGECTLSDENVRDGKSVNYAITRSIKNLLSDGLIETFNSEHQKYFRLTSSGKHKINNIILDAESSLVSTQWDGFWRIIILDIPEDRKSEREALRYLLKKAGFICMKNSVWISMYPFEHLFTNIKKDLELSTEMMIIVTDKIDTETEKEFISLCK